MKNMSQVIMMHRKHSGLSRNALADIAGVGKTVLYDIEHGKETVRFDSLKRVLDALNIKIVLDSPVMDYIKNSIKKEMNNEKS